MPRGVWRCSHGAFLTQLTRYCASGPPAKRPMIGGFVSAMMRAAAAGDERHAACVAGQQDSSVQVNEMDAYVAMFEEGALFDAYRADVARAGARKRVCTLPPAKKANRARRPNVRIA